MNALLTLIGLLLLVLLALGCTVLVLVAIVLSLMPPEMEDRYEGPTGQSSEHGLRRGWRLFWPRGDKAVRDAPGLARALHQAPSTRLHPRGRPR